MEPVPGEGVMWFADCALELSTGELRRAGTVIALGGRPARLLGLLAWRHGELTTRDQIQAALWPDGTTVEFDQSINQHVRLLRQVLGDAAAQPTWIQTLAGRGYRFLVDARYEPPARRAARGDGATTTLTDSSIPSDGSRAPEVPTDSARPTGASRALAPATHRDVSSDPATKIAAGPVSSTDASRALAPATHRDVSTGPPAGGVAADRPSETSRVRSSAESEPAATMPRAVPSDPATGRPAGGVATDRPSEPAAAPRPRRRRAVVAVVGLALAVTGTVAALAASGSAPGAPEAVRIAVLPLAADDAASEPPALALTEDLITALGEGYAPAVEAIALHSALRYADRRAPAEAIGRELGVAYLVEGRVRSHDGRRRIDVRLVRVRDATQLWARTLEEPSDAGWGVDAAIAQDIAAALGRVLLPRPPVMPLEPAAKEAFDRGRYLQQRHRPRKAAAAFVEATERAPRSARAWAARAAAELQSGAPNRRAAESAETALALDPAQPEAHFVRAMIAFYGEWSVDGARAHFAAAIRANPAYAEAHHAMAACYSAEGRHDEAIAAMARARTLDPQAPEVVSDVGWYYYFARRFDEGAAWCARTLELEPAFFWAHRCIVLSRVATGDRVRAILAALADASASGGPVAAIASAPDPLAAYWRWDLGRESQDASDRAATRVQLGDLDGALDELERAADEARGWLLPFLAVDPTFDALRTHPRFARLLARVHAGTALR